VENGPELNMEKPSQESALSLLNRRAEKVQSSVKEISPEKKQSIKETVNQFSQIVPETILVGGNALRIWLDRKNLFVPQEFGEDFDFTLNREKFDKLNNIFTNPDSQNSITEKYRKKGFEKTPFGERDFNKDPNNYIALEDKENYSHIDVFANDKEPFEKIDYQGIKLNIIPPEELFIKYANKTKDELEKGQIQRRTLTYFYLSSLIVDEQKVDAKIQQINKENGTNLDWEKEVKDLDTKIQQAKITEEVIH
jgi:hypothetical protein